jgi:hypothetical protein
MKRTLTFLGSLSLLTMLLCGADATGKWKGSFDAGGESRQITFDLKTSGDTVTGTIAGMPEKTSEIKEGKLQGSNVSFWFMTEYQGNPIKLVCKGQLSGDEIKFSMGLEDGQWSTEFVAKKGS